jgi:uncharacterized protein (DUF302 family)
MKYIVESLKSVEQVVEDLEAATKRHGFGVLHQHDLKATLDSKGVGLDHECRVLEVCNPGIAKEVLSADMTMNMALPCRISVWEEDGRTWIGMIRPTALLEVLSNDPSLVESAMDVERATVRIIEEARTG